MCSCIAAERVENCEARERAEKRYSPFGVAAAACSDDGSVGFSSCVLVHSFLYPRPEVSSSRRLRCWILMGTCWQPETESPIRLDRTCGEKRKPFSDLCFFSEQQQQPTVRRVFQLSRVRLRAIFFVSRIVEHPSAT